MDKEAKELIEAKNELNEIDSYAFAMKPEKRKGRWIIDWRHFKIIFKRLDEGCP